MKKIFTLFGRVTICLPWFAEGSLLSPEKEKHHFFKTLYPPQSMKPEKGFHRLLSEYKLWVKQNLDKGYVSSLKASREFAGSEETPWNIRQKIQNAGEKISFSEEKNAFRWHLILHLALEYEKSQYEAEKILDAVKRQKPPLVGAIEGDAESFGLFEDLPQFDKGLFADENHLSRIFEAWIGLFGQYIENHGPLVTLDPHVIKYATDIFEERKARPSDEEVSFPEGPGSMKSRVTRRHLPNISDKRIIQGDPVSARLSGKTIILLEKQ